MRRGTPLQLLELDIDARILGVWLDAWEIGWDGENAGPLLRLAYGTGYRDALTEQPRGKLYRDHGVSVPDVMRPG